MKKRISRPSAGLVVGVIAVVLAASGIATALPGSNTVDAGDLKRNSVTTPKIKKNAVTKGKIKAGAVASGKIAAGAVTEGKIAGSAVTADKIAAGAVSSSRLGAITARTVQDNIAETSAANPDRGEVDCQPGEIALAASMSPSILGDDGDLAVTELTFDPNGATNVAGDQGWIIGIANNDKDGDNSAVAVTRRVLCLAP